MEEELNAILIKAARGEKLSDGEKNFLKEEAPRKFSALTRQNQELAERLSALETQTLPETEKMKRRFETEVAALKEQLTQSESARSAASEALEALRYRRRTDEIARDCGFSDPDYFEFLCRKNAFDPAQETADPDFVKHLKETHPRFFRLDLLPGPADQAELPAVPATYQSIEEMLTDAPSISE